MNTNWYVSKSNDVGPDDDYYDEFYTVENGEKSYRADSKEDAEFLVNLLNNPQGDRLIPKRIGPPSLLK